MEVDRNILPRHKRVENPPRIQLTERDVQVILAVYDYRVLRRDQIERMFFPSKNTANERLKLLYQHRFLERRWLPVEYGEGMGQAIYLLDKQGADVVAEQLGIDRGGVSWQDAHNHVLSIFLEHVLLVNDMRITFNMAARQAGYTIDKWIKEDELKAAKEYVYLTMPSGTKRKVAVIADAYFVLDLGDKRAHFFLEVDRATEANKRWAQKVKAYQVYAQSGKYTERFGTRSLRVITVTTGEKRLSNIKRATEETGGGQMFWFTTFEKAQPEEVLKLPIWKVAGQQEACTL